MVDLGNLCLFARSAYDLEGSWHLGNMNPVSVIFCRASIPSSTPFAFKSLNISPEHLEPAFIARLPVLKRGDFWSILSAIATTKPALVHAEDPGGYVR